MSEEKFGISDGRLLKILEFVASCMATSLGLKFPKKGLRDNTKVTSCGDGEGLFIEMRTSGKAKSRPEVWFHVGAGMDDKGDMPDAYILNSFVVFAAPWDSFARAWELAGEYAFVVFDPKTDKILDVDWGSEYDFDDDEKAPSGNGKSCAN